MSFFSVLNLSLVCHLVVEKKIAKDLFGISLPVVLKCFCLIYVTIKGKTMSTFRVKIKSYFAPILNTK